MADQISVGDTVEFTDEFGQKQISIVTAIGSEAKGTQNGTVAIQGSYGSYIRKPAEIRKVSGESNETSST